MSMKDEIVAKHKEIMQNTLDKIAEVLESKTIRIRRDHNGTYSVSFRDDDYREFASLDDASKFALGIRSQVEAGFIILEM